MIGHVKYHYQTEAVKYVCSFFPQYSSAYSDEQNQRQNGVTGPVIQISDKRMFYAEETPFVQAVTYD